MFWRKTKPNPALRPVDPISEAVRRVQELQERQRDIMAQRKALKLEGAAVQLGLDIAHAQLATFRKSLGKGTELKVAGIDSGEQFGRL